MQHHVSRTLGAGLASLALTATLALTPAQAAPVPADLGRLSDYITRVADSGTSEVVPGRYFVAVQGKSIARGGSAKAIKNAQANVRASAKAAGIAMKVTKSYDTVWNGFTVDVADEQAPALQAIPGVTAVYPVFTVDRPVTTADPDMATAVDMTGASVARTELGYTGKGIKVGVIDSGIDIDHPDLGGTGVPKTTPFPNAKVAGGYDFVGDDYDPKKGTKPVADPIPDDCGGHGSHVSGIIAGQGDPDKKGVRGVAPDATLYGYRVFGCTGSTDTDNILQAMEMAGKDGMDVVNMSLGSAFETWPDYPDAQAANALTERGTIVVISAGNSGEKGAMSTGSPSVAANAISVASFENTMITAPALQVAGSTIGYSNAEGAPLAPKTGTMPIVVGDPVNGCAPLAPVPAGAAVLLQRGTCTFRDKAVAAQAAGAKALVMFNNQPGTLSPTVEGDPAITIPVVMISQADGEAIKAAAGTGSTELSWTGETVSTPNPEAGLVSSFSSWGLAADLTVKPDLGAPGGNIWSSVPLEKGGYESMSGTSMAAPHVSGAVALLLQARPELKGKYETVRELLQNTATPENAWSLAPTLGVPEMVVRQGAGLMHIDRAITSKQFTDTGKITLGDADTNPGATTVTVTNTADAPVTYALSNLTGVGHLGNSDPSFDLLDANVAMPETLTVPAGGSASFQVTITAPADAPAGFVYGGYLQLKADGAQALTIPYAGMAGDYQSLQLLTDGITGTTLPSLGRIVGKEISLLPKAEASLPVFTMTGTDVPVVVFHLEYPASDVRIDVYEAKKGVKGKLLGNIITTGEMGRDETRLTLPWDGSYQQPHSNKTRTVKAGNYFIEISALRPMANPSVAANWETWTSQEIVLRVPKAPKGKKHLTVAPA